MGGYEDLWKLPLPLIIAMGMFKSGVFELARIEIQSNIALLTTLSYFHAPPVAAPQSDVMTQDKSLN